MAGVVRVHQHGGPDVLRYEEAEIGEPKEGQNRIRQKACGLNFIDTYFRTGLYPTRLPFVPGNEGAREVIAVGPGVSGFSVGQRVAYLTNLGGYAEERIVAAAKVVELPPGVSDEHAAAAMLKGLTAHYLLHRTFPVRPGHVILMHAAAG